MKTKIAFFLFVLSGAFTLAAGFAMTWEEEWKDILSGGPQRWIVADIEHKQAALDHIIKHDSTSDSKGKDTSSTPSLSILCPLAGDDRFVHHAWSQGHSMTTIDLVPAAVASMRKQFGPDDECWTKEKDKETGMVIWKHSSQRATLYQGDAFTPLKELKASFDAVYDKDSFGALDKDLRSKFCERLADYAKPGAIVYIEVKNKPDGPARLQGPPFHVEKEDLMHSFGPAFEHVESLGEVYEFPSSPGREGLSQMGHLLKRLPQ